MMRTITEGAAPEEQHRRSSRSLLMKTNRRAEEGSRPAAGLQPGAPTPEHTDSPATNG